MKPITMDEYNKLEVLHGVEGYALTLPYNGGNVFSESEIKEKLEKAIQISDNCRELLKKWAENGGKFGHKTAQETFHDCIENLLQAIEGD